MAFSKYPESLDDSSTLPVTIDNVTPVKAEIVNRLRSSVISTQTELGVLPSGTFGTVRARLDDLDQTIKNIEIVTGSLDLSEITERIAILEGEVDDLETDIAALNATLTDHINDLDNPHQTAAGGGGPDLVDPSTDNAIVRFDGIEGQQQDSANGPFVEDDGELRLINNINLTGRNQAGNAWVPLIGIDTSNEINIGGLGNTDVIINANNNVGANISNSRANFNGYVEVNNSLGTTSFPSSGAIRLKGGANNNGLFFQSVAGEAVPLVTPDAADNINIGLSTAGSMGDIYLRAPSGQSVFVRIDGYDRASINSKGLGLNELDDDPTGELDKGFVYTKDITGLSELFFVDSSGQPVQITSDGYLNVTGLTVGGSPTHVQYNDAGELAGNADFSYDGTNVTLANVLNADGGVDTSGASALSIGETNANAINVGNSTTSITFNIEDNSLTAFEVLNKDEPFLIIDTTDGYNLKFGNNTYDPAFNFQGSGSVILGELTGDESSLNIRERLSDPTSELDFGKVYTKDESGNTELFYIDSNDNVIQITDDGYLNAVAFGGISGEGIDNTVVRWDGYRSVQSSGILLDDNDDASGFNSLAIGIDAADVGALRLPNNEGVYFRDQSNLNNVQGIFFNTDDQIIIGDASLTTLLRLNSASTVEVPTSLNVGNDEKTLLGDGYLELGELDTDPNDTPGRGVLYTKDISNVSELFFLDDTGQAVQLTDDGYIAGFLEGGTDNRLVRWQGSTNVQDSGVTLDDSDNASGFTSIAFGSDPADTGTIRLDSGDEIRFNPTGAGTSSLLISGSGTDVTVGDATNSGLNLDLNTGNAVAIRHASTETYGFYNDRLEIGEPTEFLKTASTSNGTGDAFAITGQAVTVAGTNNTGGDIDINPGGASGGTTSNTGGALNLTGAQGQGASTATGGEVNVTGGQAISGLVNSGGDVNILGGPTVGVGDSFGGNVNIIGGVVDNASGTDGSVFLKPGSGGTNRGSVSIQDRDNVDRVLLDGYRDVTINSLSETFFQIDGDLVVSVTADGIFGPSAEISSNQDGGDLVLGAGAGDGSGVDGYVRIQDGYGLDRIIVESNGEVTVSSEFLNLEGALRVEAGTTPSSLTGFGSLYVQNFGGTSELFYINSEGNTTQLTADGYTSPVLSLLPVLDVTKDLTQLGYSNNATPDVAGGGDPIQDAIDFFIAEPDVFSAIYIPPALFRLTQPLIIKNNDDYAKVTILGGTSAGYPGEGCVLQLDGDMTFDANDLAVIFIQGGRACKFTGISFENSANTEAALADSTSPILQTSISDWVTGSERTNVYSPCAAVAIDPFMDGDPGGNSSNQYPGFSSEYDGYLQSEYVTFERCAFSGGYVGTSISTADEDIRSSNILFDNCVWNGNAISHFSRATSVELRSPIMRRAYVHLDNQILGPVGGVQRSAPILTGTPRAELARYLLSLNGDDNFKAENLKIENVPSLGEFGVDVGNDNHLITFENCNLTFSTASEQGLEDGDVDYNLLTASPTQFNNCVIGSDSGQGVLKFINTSTFGGLTTFRNTFFSNTNPGNSLSVGIVFPEMTKLIDCKALSTEAGGQITINNFLSRWEFFESTAEVQLTKVGSETTANQATVTITGIDVDLIQVGDVLVVWDGSSNAISLPRVNEGEANEEPSFTPIGVVDSIDAGTGELTVNNVSSAALFATNYEIYLTRVSVEFGETNTLQQPDYLNGLAGFTGDGYSITVNYAFTGNGGTRRSFGSDYFVLLSREANENIWVTNKGTTSFTINNDTLSETDVGWQIVPNPTYGNTVEAIITDFDDISGLIALVDPRGVADGAWPGGVDSLGNTLITPTFIGSGTIAVPQVSSEELVFSAASRRCFVFDSIDPNDLDEFTLFTRVTPTATTLEPLFTNLPLIDPRLQAYSNFIAYGSGAADVSFTGTTVDQTIIYVKTSGFVIAYKNGVEVGRTSNANQSLTSGNLVIGGVSNQSGFVDYLNGTMKVAGVYNRAISSRQALAIHNVMQGL